MRERKGKWLIFLMFLLVMFIVGGISVYVRAAEEKKVPKVGPVKLNPHPSSLEGKTVLLRWNGKYNGDKFLTRVGELLAQQVRNVRVVKMWEVDSSTASMSSSLEASEKITAKIAGQNPDIVIASQAD
jgi:hypothetical protein